MTRTIPSLEDYATSRAAFLASAERHGATLEHHVHPRTGPDGGELATDVARLGPPPGEARRVVVVASGTHGVEGHAGSGLQGLVLDDPRTAALPQDTAMLLVHAVNPFGMAWSRRVDHDNVDVNRNFVDFGGPLPASEHYPRIDAILNPAGDDYDLDDASWLDELLVFAGEVGMAEAFQSVSGGQYDHPQDRSHRVVGRVRRAPVQSLLLAGEQDDLDRALETVLAEEPGRLEQGCTPGPVVVGARRRDGG